MIHIGNYCKFDLLAKGEEKDLIALETYLTTNYYYTSTVDNFLKHIDDMLKYNIISENMHYAGFGNHPSRVLSFSTNRATHKTLKGFGQCAWSVKDSMVSAYVYITDDEEEFLELKTYQTCLQDGYLAKIKKVYPDFQYEIIEDEYERLYFKTNIRKNFKSIEDLAKEHNLIIQILSEETSTCFSENIIVNGIENTVQSRTVDIITFRRDDIIENICKDSKDVNLDTFKQLSKTKQRKHIHDYLSNAEFWLEFNKDEKYNTSKVAKQIVDKEYFVLGTFDEFTI